MGKGRGGGGGKGVPMSASLEMDTRPPGHAGCHLTKKTKQKLSIHVDATPTWLNQHPDPQDDEIEKVPNVKIIPSTPLSPQPDHTFGALKRI